MAEQKSYFKKTIIAADNEGLPTVLLTGVECTVFDVDDNLAVIYHPVTQLATANPFPVTNGIAAFWAEPEHYRVNFVDTQIPSRIAEENYHWDAVSAKFGGMNADFIENNSININHLMTIVQRALVPVGAVFAYGAGPTAPDGYFLADGSEKSVTTYAALSALCGTAFGPLTNGSGGAGSSHFRLPNLKGRVPIGAGSGVGDGASGAAGTNPAGTALTTHALGSWTGREGVTLTGAQSGVPVHGHSASSGDDSPDHAHHMHMQDLGSSPPGMIVDAGGKNVWRMSSYTLGTGGTNPAINDIQNNSAFDYGLGVDVATNRHQHAITVNNNGAADAASAHTNVQPQLALNYIIRHGL